MDTQDAQRRNPISTRLYKILSTNFDDQATHEALTTLSELYTSPLDPAIKGKGKDTASYNEDSPAVRARRSLRRDMEQNLARGNRQFLDVFGEVDQVRRVSDIELCIRYLT